MADGVVVVEPITEVTHPLLQATLGNHEHDFEERECNMVVVVEYRGIKYRVDFEKYDELKLLPRSIKKAVALEDIKQYVDARDIEIEKQRVAQEQLKKKEPAYVNQQKQSAARSGIVQRLREKLLKKNPLRKDVRGTTIVSD